MRGARREGRILSSVASSRPSPRPPRCAPRSIPTRSLILAAPSREISSSRANLAALRSPLSSHSSPSSPSPRLFVSRPQPPRRGGRRDGDEPEKPAEPHVKVLPAVSAPSELPPISHLKRTLAPVMPSIVKIRVVESAPDYAIPWQQNDTEESSGSGCVITLADGRQRVLTNAHVVHNHTFVRLQKQGSAQQFVAQVSHVSYDCDLAVLEVDDPVFFRGCTSMSFAATPNLQDPVIVLGYPEGGDSISVTKGIVSRLELTNFAGGSFGVTHDDGLKLLSLQIDAALNPGNSGGPAVNEHNQVIGIVFSKLTWSENVGYLVPSEVVLHFLKDIEAGRQPQFCSPGFYYQSCENASLRARKLIPSNQSGVLVIAVDPMSPANADGSLRRGDVILCIDDVPIADDGTISAQDAGIAAAEHLRLSFEYLISVRKFVGDKVTYRILRDGVTMTIAARQYLVPPFSALPSYFLHAGLLFVPLSEPYLNAMDTELPVIGRVFYRNTKSVQGEEIIVIMKVLTDEVNIGFDHLELPKQIVSVNGVKVKNLPHLIECVENCKEKFLELELDSGELIILDTTKARESNQRIMRRYKVHSLRSANLVRGGNKPNNGSKHGNE